MKHVTTLIPTWAGAVLGTGLIWALSPSGTSFPATTLLLGIVIGSAAQHFFEFGPPPPPPAA